MNRSPPRPPGRTRLPDRLTIRDFREGDEAGVLAALRDLQHHESQFNLRIRPADTMGPWYIDRLKDEIARSGWHLLVAETGDGVVGYASITFGTAGDQKDELPHSYAEVGDLAVCAAQRSKGAGAALLATCEKIARDAGLEYLRLGVLARNGRAREFYLRHGLEEVYVTLEKKLR